MQIPLWKNIFYFFVRSARFPLRGGIYLALQGFLTRAKYRALRMTAENGESALEFTRLPLHSYGCHAVHLLFYVPDI